MLQFLLWSFNDLAIWLNKFVFCQCFIYFQKAMIYCLQACGTWFAPDSGCNGKITGLRQV